MTETDAFSSIVRTLQKSPSSHAFVIVGKPEAAGGRLATSVAQYVLCTGREKPCRTCRACELVSKHLHPDLYWIEPEKKSRVIPVDRIRDVSRNIFQTSHEGGWKVCVVSEADRIMIQAENAFLKTLEEPPQHTLFMLVTENPQSLLPTILSRCWRITLHGDDFESSDKIFSCVIQILLDRHEVLKKGVPFCIAAIESSVRILNILREMKEMARKDVETSDEEIEEMDEDTIEARIETKYRKYRTNLMKWLLTWYRDLLILRLVPEAEVEHVHFKHYIDNLKIAAGYLSVPQAIQNIEIIQTMNKQLEENLAERMVFYRGFQELHI
jgi:DNA polymerase-3 subunit delta'